MGFSMSSFFASGPALVFLTLVLRFLLFKTIVLLKFGIVCIYIFVIFILLRGYLPFDFYSINLTTSFYSHNILPLIENIIHYKLFSLAQSTITIRKFLSLIWFTGSIIFLSKRIYGYFYYKRILLFNEKADEDVLKIYNKAFTFLIS